MHLARFQDRPRSLRASVLAGALALLSLAKPVWSQQPVPVMPAPTAPTTDLADAVGSPVVADEPVMGRPFLAPPYGAPEGPPPAGARVTMSVFDAALESLFGDPYAPGKWRPLSLGTFFTEGWDEAWAGAPAGKDGLTPRHGWLGSFDGVFYRLWLTTFSYQNNLNTPTRGNRYTGDYTIFLPLSRRFEIRFDIPFVVSNGTTTPGKGYTSQFGDFTIVPRFLLSETAATSQTFALDIRTPTGTTTTANGIMSLTPKYEFWTNPGGPWVVRGSAGVGVPLNQPTLNSSFVGGLDVGRYFTPHDVPFGDLVIYAATNWRVPFGNDAVGTYFSVGPGTRFHIAKNWFFLGFWEVPVTGPQAFTYNAQFAIMKVF